MKVKSDMPFHFNYSYLLAASAKQFFFLKGMAGHVLWIDYVSIYNPTANDFTHLYLLCRDKGVVTRCDYHASLATVTVKKFPADHYLSEGEEAGIEITGTAITDEVEVTVHGIRYKDEDYFKAT